MGQGLALAQHPLHQDLDAAARFLAPPQPGRNDPGIVEDQQIARAQQIRQVPKAAIGNCARRPIQMQQPAGRPLGNRVLGDELRREIETEVGSTHGARA